MTQHVGGRDARPRRITSRSRRAWTRPQPWFWSALAVIVALAGALAIVDARRRGDVLLGDEALTAREALHIGEFHPRLGVYTTASEFISRDLRNPGPALYVALYPFVRLLGTDTGAWTFAVVTALISLALGTMAAWRAGRTRPAVLALLGMLLLLSHGNHGALLHSLNTEVVLLPTMACAFMGWSVARLHTRWLAVLAVTVSFVMQTFVGLAPLVAAITLASCTVLVVRLARGQEGGHVRRHLALTAAVTLVLWLPPLEDQVRGTGNLVGLLRFRAPGRGWAGRRLRSHRSSISGPSSRGAREWRTSPTVLGACW